MTIIFACPNCGEQIDKSDLKDSFTCSSCGELIYIDEIETHVLTYYCPECGSKMMDTDAGYFACLDCGTERDYNNVEDLEATFDQVASDGEDFNDIW